MQGGSFRENRPPAPVKNPQKLFIKDGHSLQPGKILMQTMTAFGFFCNFGHCKLLIVNGKSID
jgi:hypothetical protein